MSIQWFPGHMVAAQKKSAETMEFTDIVIEVLDARVPQSSKNPLIESLRQARQRPYLVVLNKSDLADPEATSQWLNYFNKQPKTKAIAISCKKPGDAKRIFTLCKALAPHRGTPLKPLRMMIMGIPNVGKSTLMNTLLSKKIAKVADEPAVTKQQQRHQINDHMILIDTPGMMWPKIDSEDSGYKLAASNLIGKNAYFEEEVAEYLASYLLIYYGIFVKKRYGIESEIANSTMLMEMIAKKKSFPLKNKLPDLLKASITLLTDYRQGSLGRISLELPNIKPKPQY